MMLPFMKEKNGKCTGKKISFTKDPSNCLKVVCVQFHFYAYSPSTHMGQLFSAFFLSSREHLETWEIEIYTGSKT